MCVPWRLSWEGSFATPWCFWSSTPSPKQLEYSVSPRCFRTTFTSLKSLCNTAACKVRATRKVATNKRSTELAQCEPHVSTNCYKGHPTVKKEAWRCSQRSSRAGDYLFSFDEDTESHLDVSRPFSQIQQQALSSKCMVYGRWSKSWNVCN